MLKHSDERKGGSDSKEARRGLPRNVSAVPTPTAAQAFKLRAIVRGIHWEAGKQLLDMLEFLIPTDRQWAIARKQAMDILSSANKNEDAAINSILFAQPAQPVEKE